MTIPFSSSRGSLPGKGLLVPPTELSLRSITDGNLHIDTRTGATLVVDVHLS